MPEEAFLRLFSGLPRQGPGSDRSTLQALRRLPELPPNPRVLDLGCGTGRQTLVLARTLRGRITAVDTHAPFLEELSEAANKAGLGDIIETRELSMDALDYPEESFDLIWCEGAAYILGIPRALELWRPLLRSGGCLAFTEITWLVDSPPDEATRFWNEAYPAMDSVAGNHRRVEAAGLRLLDSFVLPAEDWWQDYYNPLSQCAEALREQSEDWPELAAVIGETEREIEIFSRHHTSYSYVFYLCVR